MCEMKRQGASMLSTFAIFKMNIDHHIAVQLEQLLIIMEMVKMNWLTVVSSSFPAV